MSVGVSTPLVGEDGKVVEAGRHFAGAIAVRLPIDGEGFEVQAFGVVVLVADRPAKREGARLQAGEAALQVRVDPAAIALHRPRIERRPGGEQALPLGFAPGFQLFGMHCACYS